MNNRIRFVLLLVFYISCLISGHAQGFQVERKTAPSTSSNFEPFTSLDGRFAISLPQTVSSYQPMSLKTSTGTATGQGFTWRMAEGLFSVVYLDRPESLNDNNAASRIFDQVSDRILAQISAAKGKLSLETNISLSEHPGREYKIELSDSLLTARLYLVNNRVYQLLFVAPPGQQSQEASAAKVLDSFKLLSAADIEVILKKQLAEATPAALPQKPVVKRPRSDAEDEGLRGKIKVVASEAEDLSDTLAVSKRKPSSTDYYNEHGALMKTESYDYRGNLRDITVYGYIDGERVSQWRSIRREYDPPPAMAPAAAGPAPRRDSRYSSRYRYKYNDKRNLVEKELYGNDGSLRMRYVYNLKGNQKEELAYASDGSLNHKSLLTQDDKALVIERIEYNPKDGSIRDRYSYKYELDAKGNWIKRTASKWVSKDGKSDFAPAWITYRSLTYYQ